MKVPDNKLVTPQIPPRKTKFQTKSPCIEGASKISAASGGRRFSGPCGLLNHFNRNPGFPFYRFCGQIGPERWQRFDNPWILGPRMRFLLRFRHFPIHWTPAVRSRATQRDSVGSSCPGANLSIRLWMLFSDGHPGRRTPL